MVIKDWNIEAVTGYKPITTFYTDFSIAERFGKHAIKDTYIRAFSEWKDSITYVTELAMVLNWKIWEHWECENSYANLYDELYFKLNDWILKHYKGDELKYYLDTTD